MSFQMTWVTPSLLPARVGACRRNTGTWMSRAEPAISIVALNLVTDEYQSSWMVVTNHLIGLCEPSVEILMIQGRRQ